MRRALATLALVALATAIPQTGRAQTQLQFNNPQQILAAGANSTGAAALQQTPSAASSMGSSTADAAPQSVPNGPSRLRQSNADTSAAGSQGTTMLPPAPPARIGDFELYVGLPRFGADMVNELANTSADFSPVVPPDYVLQGGDEIQLTLWGSVDADLRLTLDRTGRVSIPRVGPVMLAGVRYADAHDVIARRVSQTFKNFELSVALGRLRGVRVFATGFVQRAGAYSVAGLSTVVNAVMRAGGPSAAGSLRHVELRRQGKLVTTIDIYDLLLRGDRSADMLVQPDDVIYVGPIGPQVAIRGSVNRPAVYELKAGETLKDLMRMAGGLNAVADRKRLALERLDERNDSRVVFLPMPDKEGLVLANGDVLRAYSAVEQTLSVERQNRRVRVEGEVASPGEYLLPPGSSLPDAIRAAGGLSPSAFVYGTTFTRESVRLSQAENYDRALRDLETDMTRSSATRRVSGAEDVAASSAQTAATSRLFERLRTLQPNGRVVLQVEPDSAELPSLLLEDGDRLVIPPKPSSVGVFGSVFNSGNYLYSGERSLDDYLRLAGGPTRGADESSIFVIRANGRVVSSRQSAGFFSRGNQIGNLRTLPGDTVFVPEEMDKTTFVQIAKDWTLILYQLGIGLAGINSTLK